LLLLYCPGTRDGTLLKRTSCAGLGCRHGGDRISLLIESYRPIICYRIWNPTCAILTMLNVAVQRVIRERDRLRQLCTSCRATATGTGAWWDLTEGDRSGGLSRGH